MIKVLLERQVSEENYKKLIGLLNDLRAKALHQPGYVSGETLLRGDDPIVVLVISTWISEEYWKAWTTQEECIQMDNLVECLVGHQPRISVYRAPFPIPSMMPISA